MLAIYYYDILIDPKVFCEAKKNTHVEQQKKQQQTVDKHLSGKSALSFFYIATNHKMIYTAFDCDGFRIGLFAFGKLLSTK